MRRTMTERQDRVEIFSHANGDALKTNQAERADVTAVFEALQSIWAFCNIQ
jgi:hypothetical protein